MNIVLFEAHEIGLPLPRGDRRAQHIVDVLGRQVGDTFDAGIVNGPRGKATVSSLSADALTFSFAATTPPTAPAPIIAIVGLPRPQTARDILRDATTLGVAALHFVRTDRGERGYAQSSLWRSGEWRRQVLLGAEQAFDTHIPEVTHGLTLADAIAAAPNAGSRVALDNYESAVTLSSWARGQSGGASVATPAVLAVGSERGWSPAEREFLRASGFTFAHLGSRVLRAETAVVVALALVRARLGLL